MHPLQRQWDALLILHWRRDNKMGILAAHCKALLGKFPRELAEEGMLRCSGYLPHYIHVRVWVDTYLHPLGVKLWDIQDNKRVLDWVNASTGLDCDRSKKATRWQKEIHTKTKTAEKHIEQMRVSIELGKRGNRMSSPNQVKATGRGRR